MAHSVYRTSETGRYVPSAVLALKLARLFSIPVETLFSLEDTD